MIEPVAWLGEYEGEKFITAEPLRATADWPKIGVKALPLYAIPPGFAIVPVEPTEAIILAMVVGSYGELPPKQNEFHAAEFAIMRDAYKAMLTAAAKGE